MPFLGDNPEEDEIYSTRLVGVTVTSTLDGRTDVELADIDWSYTINGNRDLEYAVAGGILDVMHNSTFTSTGKSANFSLTMNDSFGSSCDITSAAIFVEGTGSSTGGTLEEVARLNLNAETTTITAHADGDDAHSIRGIAVENYGSLYMNGSTVKIDVLSGSNKRPNHDPDDAAPHEAMGLQAWTYGKIFTSENTTLDITVTGMGDNENTFPIATVDNDVASEITGIANEGSTMDLRGTTNVNVHGNGNWSVGAQIWSEGVDTSFERLDQKLDFDSSVTFGKSATFTVRSEKSQAIGLLVGGAWYRTDATDEEREKYAEYLGKVTVTAEGDLTITAESPNENHRSVGIAFNRWGGGDAEVTLKGKTVITAEDALGTFGDELIASEPVNGENYNPLKEAVFTLNNSADLTLNGNVDKYTGKFVQTAGLTTINAENDQFFGGVFEMSGGTLKAEDYVGTADNPFTMTGGSAEFNDFTGKTGGSFSVSNADAFAIGGKFTVEKESDVKFASDNGEGTITAGSVVSRGNIDALGVNFVIDGGDSFFDEVARKPFEGPANGEGEIRDYASRFGSLTVNGGTVENHEGMLIMGDLVLNDVYWNNADGDVEVFDGMVILGEGTVFNNFGGLHGDWFVLKTGSVYYEEDDEFPNGIMSSGTVDGVVDFAGGELLPMTPELFNGFRMDESVEDNGLLETQLIFSAGEYEWNELTINVAERSEGERLEVNGGSLSVGHFYAGKGDASVSGGEFHVGTLNSTGKFTMAGGGEGSFTVGTFKGAEGGDFTLASGVMAVDHLDLTNGLLTVAEGANLSTFSGEIFTPGLGEDGKTPAAEGLVYGTDHLLFADGSTLTIRDQFYNNDYFDSADALLGDVNLVFTGTLVDGSGEMQDEIDYDEIRDGETHANSDISAPAAGADGTVTVDKSVGGKTFVVKDGTSVAVNNDKTLTLVGSAEGGELVVFEDGAADKTVSVEGGLALGVASPDVAPTKGTITSDVTLADGSTLTATNGEFTLKRVAAEGADITVDSGSLTVESLAVTNDNQLKGTLDADTVTGDWTIGAAYDLGVGGDDRLDNAFTLKARYVW